MSSARGVPVRDTILWVEDTGEVDLPVILCLHSLFVDGRMFEGLVREAKGRFRVVRPDFRSQGSSAPATGEIVSMEECAEDMLALIDVMKLPPLHIAAASMGGDVAVRMAAARPNLFSSMLMMGSSVRAEPPDQKAQFTQLLERTLATGFAGEDLEMLMAIMFGAATRGRRDMQPILDYWRVRMELLPRSAWPAMYGVLERKSASAALRKIKTPTLIINGKDDIARPPAWAKEVAEGIKSAELMMLDGIGHSPILEAPDIVIPRMLQFFERASGGARQSRKLFGGLLG